MLAKFHNKACSVSFSGVIEVNLQALLEFCSYGRIWYWLPLCNIDYCSVNVLSSRFINK
jgi:hypothetical protein